MLRFIVPLCVTPLLLGQAIFVPGAKLDAAYPKHGIVLDRGHFRLMAIGREQEGQAEIHAADSDVLYFVAGAATLVTGGELKHPKVTAPGETRGPSLEGGERRELKAGDVVTIPNGMSHRFVNIQGPCRYFLVKIRTRDAGKPSVLTALMKGGALASGDGYKVSASHRDKDGIAEWHARDTDIMYFVRGTATLVTGGTITERKTTGPEEVRGAMVEGGVRQAIQPGDAVVVPNTVSHQFVDVRGPLDYFVVKVRSIE
ncbi:MAG: hypothetical protein K2X03_09895 [Bryobacteraceae bacterium]|nr:hypothetical protein [Bryobacteraceae bacterium]